MARKTPTLKAIDGKLARAARILDDVAGNLRDAKFNPRANIYRVGHALSRIFEIQNEIYRVHPELLPKYLHGTALHRELLFNSRSNGRAKSARRSPKR